jgi:hypothetical protein
MSKKLHNLKNEGKFTFLLENRHKWLIPFRILCYESIRHKVDQTQRRQILLVKSLQSEGEKTTGVGQQQYHYFLGGYRSRETYNEMTISCGL